MHVHTVSLDPKQKIHNHNPLNIFPRVRLA